MSLKNRNNRLCQDLLGLYFTSPDCDLDEYVHAFSFKRSILENMIECFVPEKEREYYSIKHIKIYHSYESNRNTNIIKPKRTLLFYCKKLQYDQINCLIYGYNMPEKKFKEGNMYNTYNQVLVSTSIITDEMIENGISENSLDIDTFYEESILNA
jgi:hypothetical protein